MAACDHIDTGGDHGRGVNESGDRRRAFHSVRKPDIERNLSGLAGRSHKEQKADGGEESAGKTWRRIHPAEDIREIQAAEVRDQEEHRKQKAEIADPVHDERLLAGIRRGVALEVKANEKVRGETNALPPNEHQQEARCQHEHQHEEHEEVQVREEAPVTLFLSHIADRVNVNEETDASDDAEHDEREVVDGEGEVDLEAADRDPWGAAEREMVGCSGRLHIDPELRNNQRRQRRREERNGRNESAREPATQRSVHEEAGKGQSRDEPEQSIVHAVYAGSLVLHEVDLIDVQGLACAEERDDDRETDGSLCRGDDHNEEDEDLPLDAMPHVGEGDEGQIDGIEHQLNGHEDRDDIALDEKGADADREEHRGEDEIPCDGNHLAVLLAAQALGDQHQSEAGRDAKSERYPAVARAAKKQSHKSIGHDYCSFLASTTAPRIATRIRMEVTSNGSSNEVKSVCERTSMLLTAPVR